MNKQEAIELLQEMAEESFELAKIHVVYIDSIVEVVNEIDEPQKPKVSRAAVEFYEKYKDEILSLDEWFSDFYSKEAIEDFPRMEELTEWLHGNDSETNRRRELALATLVTLGIDAVDIEQEKLYTVDIPNPVLTDNSDSVTVLMKTDFGVALTDVVNYIGRKQEPAYQLTESEIKQDFEWLWQWAKEVE
ncbi:TPA: DUF1642 domain-containing protein [Streptococcus suis]